MTNSTPGSTIYGDGDLILNDGRPVTELDVSNSGDRAVQVGSHFHFFEANAALRFDREASFGMRLDIPSGTAIRFEAGQTHRVALIPFGGARRILGFNGLTIHNDRSASILRAKERGFFHE